MTTGLVIGKFMPPTVGHMALLDTAYEMCGNDLDIAICVNETMHEKIGFRLEAIQSRYKRGKLLYHKLPEEMPLESTWAMLKFKYNWFNCLSSLFKRTTYDYVFASESYGKWLADYFRAEFIPLDRQSNAISATIVRQNVFSAWDKLMPEFRQLIVPRVVVAGPESTGKTTLARNLAVCFNTVWVPEWARTYLEHKEDKFPRPENYELFLKVQSANEDALAKQANRVLICDSDAKTTVLYAHVLSDIPYHKYHNYSVTRGHKHELILMCHPDVPYVKDDLRYNEIERVTTVQQHVDMYNPEYQKIVNITGDWNGRFTKAVVAIQQHLEQQASLYR